MKTSVAATALASLDFPALASKVRSYGKERLKVGILSDIHVINEATHKCFLKALNYFKEKRVDAVMIAGDLINNGVMTEYRAVVNDWYSVFPDDKYPDGKKVERLIVHGNHDIEGHTYGNAKKRYGEEVLKREAILPVNEKFWEECWHEKFQPIYMKEVKGYKFIGAHYVTSEGDVLVSLGVWTGRRRVHGDIVPLPESHSFFRPFPHSAYGREGHMAGSVHQHRDRFP